jgi:glycosyltransferase involved in cell wall biosynthesis
MFMRVGLLSNTDQIGGREIFIMRLANSGISYVKLQPRVSLEFLKEINKNVDLVHSNGSFFYTSLATYAKKPIIFHCHDFHIICLTGLFDHSNLQECKDYMTSGLRPCLLRCYTKCYYPLDVKGLILNFMLSYLFRYRFKKIKLFITPTYYLRNARATRFPKIKHRILVIPHGVEDPGKPLVPRDEKTILYVGRICYYKGVFTLLKAFFKLLEEDKELKLVFIGKMRNEIIHNNLIDFCRKHLGNHYEKYIKFTGFLDQKKLTDYYFRATLSVVPSLSPESTSLVILESFAHQLPVIASKVGAIPEVVDNNGLLFAPGNVDELTEKIRYLLTDKKLRNQLAKKGRYKFEKKHQLKLVLKKIKEVYCKVLNISS